MGRRRANGEGTVYQRRDGRWVARISLPGGKRREFYGKKREDVSKWLNRTLADLDKGVAPVPQKETVAQFLERWLEDSVKQAVRPVTFDSYRDIVRLHLIPELGHHRIARLSPRHVQDMLNRKLETPAPLRKGRKTTQPLSPRRVQYVRAVLRKALNQAVKWEVVGRNVAALTDSPRVTTDEVEPLNPDEAKRLLDAVCGDRLEALYSVALALGLRQGEALGLRWDDVDLDNAILRVRVALQRFDGAYHLVEPKTRRSRRALPLPRVAVETLRAHRLRQLEEKLKCGPAWGNWGLVFTTQDGRPLNSTAITHRFQRIVKQANLGHRRFHDLRHACASLLLAQGVDLRTIMEILGHSQIGLTANLYSHVLPSMKRDAADRMDAVLGGSE